MYHGILRVSRSTKYKVKSCKMEKSVSLISWKNSDSVQLHEMFVMLSRVSQCVSMVSWSRILGTSWLSLQTELLSRWVKRRRNGWFYNLFNILLC
jgi:hypothetical protein